jgi:hypothetical protein
VGSEERRRDVAGTTRILLAICFSAAALAAPSSSAQLPATSVLAVNGLAVPREEFLRVLQEERPGVVAAVQDQHGLAFDERFWTRPIGQTTAREMLLARTVSRVTHEKVEQLLFVELGLLADAGYASFQAELERSNRDRAAAFAEGRPVYGPISYTQAQYLRERASRLRIKAQETLARDRLAASDAQLRAYYRQHSARFTAPATSSWELVTLSAAPDAGDSAPSKLDGTAQEMLTRLRSGATAQDISRDPQLPGGLEIAAVRLADVPGDRLAEAVSSGESLAVMQELAPGGAAVLPGAAGTRVIAKCTARQPASRRPFEDVRSQVHREWLQEQYDALLAERVARADVRVDRTQLALITVQ